MNSDTGVIIQGLEKPKLNDVVAKKELTASLSKKEQ
jgi:hypothetical protein